jgi:hypothetical protein
VRLGVGVFTVGVVSVASSAQDPHTDGEIEEESQEREERDQEEVRAHFLVPGFLGARIL